MGSPLDGGIRYVAEYLPYAILAILGPALWLAASARRIGQVWRTSSLRIGWQ